MPKRFFIDAGSVQRLKQALVEFPPAFFDAGRAEFFEQLGILKEQMVKRSSNPPGPIPEGEGVHKQTGKLAGSWGVAVSGTSLSDLKGAAFSFSRGKAPLLEVGGEVHPGGFTDAASDISRWIPIPTDVNRGPDGRALLTPRQVLDTGGQFINRRKRQYRIYDKAGKVIGSSIAPAIIDGQASPAWNLLVPFATSLPSFILAKKARYVPLLGFYITGNKFAEILPGNLANAAVKYWREAAL